jgi:hypothetical protein
MKLPGSGDSPHSGALDQVVYVQSGTAHNLAGFAQKPKPSDEELEELEEDLRAIAHAINASLGAENRRAWRQCSGSVMCRDLVAWRCSCDVVCQDADTGMRPVHSQSLHC